MNLLQIRLLKALSVFSCLVMSASTLICSANNRQSSPDGTWKDVYIPPDVAQFLHDMPKTDLHIHLEGAFDSDLAWQLARYYGYGPTHPLLIQKETGGFFEVTSEDELKKCFVFADLLQFLNVYDALSDQLLRTKDDIRQLAARFAQNCVNENVRHVEIYTDFEHHMCPNKYRDAISFRDVVDAVWDGMETQKDLDVTIIAAITRSRPVGNSTDSGDIDALDIKNPSAWNVVNCAIEYNMQCRPERRISGLGLGGDEAGFPCSLFSEVYAKARENGLFCVAHAGEVPDAPGKITGPASIWQAIDDLHVDRLDHGVRADEELYPVPPHQVTLMTYLAQEHEGTAFEDNPHKIPLTVCPISNYTVETGSDPSNANTLSLLDSGLMVTINTDDPAYLGGYCGYEELARPGYITENYLFLMKIFDQSVTKRTAITKEKIKELVENGFNASFISYEKKQRYLAEVENFFRTHVF